MSNALIPFKSAITSAKKPVKIPPNVLKSNSGKPKAVDYKVQLKRPGGQTTKAVAGYKMPPLAELQKKFDPLTLNQGPIYDTIAQMHYTIGGIFESHTANQSTDYQPNAYSKFDNWMEEEKPYFLNAQRYIHVKDTAIETKIPLKEFAFYLDLGAVDKTLMEDSLKLIRKIIPNFTLPSASETVRDPERPEISKQQLTGLSGKSIFLIKKIPSLVKEGSYIPKKKWLGPTVPTVSDKYKEILAPISSNPDFDIAALEFEVMLDQSRLVRPSYGQKVDLTRPSSSGQVMIMISCTAIFNWPMNFALYATSASNPKDFYPYLFMQYLAEHRKAFVKNMGKKNKVGKAPPRVNHYGHIKSMIEKEGHSRNIVVNEDNFLILGSAEENYAGSVVWIEHVDKVNDYLAQMQKAYDPEEKRIHLTKADMLLNQGLFTDPNSEKFSYVNSEGNIEILDLTGSVPLDPMTIRRDLLTVVNNDDGRQFFEELDKAITQIDPQFINGKIAEDDLLARVFGVNTSLNAMFGRLTQGTAEVTWHDLGSPSFGDGNKIEAAVCNLISAAATEVLKNFDKVSIAYFAKIGHMRYRLMLINKYAHKLEEYQKIYKLTVARNSASGVSPDSKNIKIANLPGLTYLMPHQLKANNRLSTNPAAVVIDVSVGGGKCQVGSTLVPTTKGMLTVKELYQMSGNRSKERGFRAFDNKTQVFSFNKENKINMTYRTKGQTVKVTTSLGDELEGLKEHKFWALQSDGTIDFKKIEDLTVGDWLPKQIGTRVFATKAPKIPNANECNQLKTSYLTAELARVIGLVVTEGNIRKSGIVFTNSCKHTLKQYEADWNAVFSHGLNKSKCKRTLNNKVYTHTYAANSVSILKLFNALGMPKVLSAKKSVPWIIRQAPEDLQLEFLKAAFEGDGGIHKPDIGKNRWRVEYYSTSKVLAYQIKYMLENIGIASTMIRSKKRAVKTDTKGVVTYSPYKTCYIVQLAQQHIELFSQKIGFMGLEKQRKLLECVAHKDDEDFKGCDANERNYNHLVHGFINYLPVGKQVAQATAVMEDIIRPFKFLTEQGIHRVLSVSRMIHDSVTASIPYDDSMCRKHAHTVSIWKADKEVATRYSVDNFIKTVNNTRPDIKDALFADTSFKSLFANIVDATKYVWSQVTRKIDTNKPKFVYDLTIPGSNAYVANGYMSHNTGILLNDLARLLAEGKVKKGLIICPTKLVRSWVTEINNFSKGELNPFPITREGTRRLQKFLKPDSAPNADLPIPALKELLNKAPINSVYIVGLSFLSRGSNIQKILYGSQVIDRYKMAEFFKDYGFDWIGIDESQKVKNLGASQTQATSIIISHAPYKRPASGTVVNNTPADLVGQTSLINPAIFGRIQNYRDLYTIDPSVANSAPRSDAPERMHEAMLPYTGRFTAKKRDWAFALPRMHSYFHFVNLTPAQKTYYDAQFENTLDLLLNDPKVRKVLEDPDEEKAAAAAKAFEVHFQRVEAFLCAPDSVQIYANQTGLKPADLISPKLHAIEQILEHHFDELKNPFKVLIFSFRRVTPEHIYKHLSPRWQKLSKVYTSNTGMKPVIDFMKNDKVKILIANESSIKEGFNLQMASRMIRLETLWAPGDQEQAFGRIHRPSKIYKRDDVYLDYVMIDNTIEVAKSARLVSKQIAKMKYDEEDNPAFKSVPYGAAKTPVADQLEGLDLIKMSLKTIRMYSTRESIKAYTRNFQLIENWEEEQFDKLRAQKLGVVKITDAQRITIPGSKNLHELNAWIPRIEGTDPINPDILQPISIVESKMISEAEDAAARSSNGDEDEDEDVEIEVNPVKIGQLVDTEFGLGFVRKILKNDVVAYVPGLPNPLVRVPKSTTYVYVDSDAERADTIRLKKAGKKGLPRIPGIKVSDSVINPPKALPKPNQENDGKKAKDAVADPVIKKDAEKNIKNVNPPLKKAVKVLLQKVKQQQQDDDEDTDEAVVYARIINGGITLMVYEEDVNDEIFTEHGFRAIPRYMITQIKKAEGIEAIFKAVEKTGFKVPPSVRANFKVYGNHLQQQKLKTLNTQFFGAKDNFHLFRVKFPELTDKSNIKFYPFVSYDAEKDVFKLHMATSLVQQPKARKLIGKELVASNLATKFKADGPFMIKSCKDKAQAIDLLKALNKETPISDLRDLIMEIKELKPVGTKK